MKFRYHGDAAIKHLNTRKEGDDDDKALAVDLKLLTKADARLTMPYFCADLLEALWLDNGAVKNHFVTEIRLGHELQHYGMDIAGEEFLGVTLKKFVLTPADGWAVVIAFQASFNPTGTEVARLAEYLADDVILSLAPADGELDLAGAGA